MTVQNQLALISISGVLIRHAYQVAPPRGLNGNKGGIKAAGIQAISVLI